MQCLSAGAEEDKAIFSVVEVQGGGEGVLSGGWGLVVLVGVQEERREGGGAEDEQEDRLEGYFRSSGSCFFHLVRLE